MARLRVQKFDLETVKPHRSVLFVGRSGSGKSVCMRDWLRHLAPRFDAAIFFSPTLESANEFRRMVPSSFVWETPLDLGVINQICSMQRELAPAFAPFFQGEKSSNLHAARLRVFNLAWDSP